MKKLDKYQKKHLNRSYRQFELVEVLINELEENFYEIDDDFHNSLYELRKHYYKLNNDIKKILEKQKVI